MADAYVIVGLKRERCRAKDPAKCRYHVGSDGKPLKHYKDAWSADKALEREIKRQAKADSKEREASEAAVDDGLMDVEDLFVVDDGPFSSLTVTGSTDGKPVGDGKLHELSTPACKLNKMRAQAGMDTASADAAAKILMAVSRELKAGKQWATQLMWRETPDSPREWPEWWSTSENACALALDGSLSSNSSIVRPNQVTADVSWSVDKIGGDGKFSTTLQSWTAGMYDAVRNGKLKWEDLKAVGAKTAWMEASMATGRSGDEAVLKTVLSWCGRKPKINADGGEATPVIGEDSWIAPRASRSLEAMMKQVSEMSVTMDQAIIEMHVLP